MVTFYFIDYKKQCIYGLYTGPIDFSCCHILQHFYYPAATTLHTLGAVTIAFCASVILSPNCRGESSAGNELLD